LGRLRRRARGIYRWAVSFFASKTSSAVCGREDDGGGDDREGGKGDSGRPALALRCYIIGDARRVGRGRRGGTGGLGAPWTGTARLTGRLASGPEPYGSRGSLLPWTGRDGRCTCPQQIQAMCIAARRRSWRCRCGSQNPFIHFFKEKIHLLYVVQVDYSCVAAEFKRVFR
jgi:hypothetical protein